MKIAPRQTQTFLTSQAKGCKAVLIYGADEGQAREHAATLAKTLGVDPKDPFSFVEISEDQLKANPTLLHDELFAMSMMGGQRFVRLLADADGVAKTLEGIYNGKGTLPDAYLLVLAKELSARSALRNLFEAHPEMAAIACYKDENQNIGGLITQTLAKSSIQASSDAREYLIANLGVDRNITRSELEKIVLYCGEGGKLSLEDARELVGNSADTGMDDLCEALANGQIARTDAMLQKLLRESVQPIMILRSLQRYFLRLHLLAAQITQDRISVSQAVANAKPKIFFKQVPIMERQLSLWKLPMLDKALLLLTAAERACKTTGSVPEAQLQYYTTEILSLFHKARKAA